MPTKFRPTEKNYDRRTGKNVIVRHYMKAVPKQELIDYLNKDAYQVQTNRKELRQTYRQDRYNTALHEGSTEARTDRLLK